MRSWPLAAARAQNGGRRVSAVVWTARRAWDTATAPDAAECPAATHRCGEELRTPLLEAVSRLDHRPGLQAIPESGRLWRKGSVANRRP
ncbi:hypothetical protein NDU88_005340 [Pleurodeles waltl]|uniref:Uncharacterized protein n=1 Tax=Pleurodeles waltl TaxID=8319 RepID=A0AAV7RKT5_PLEWA|nr:hypothetical protein NDU88_005340 [Pleurodeles waltl]